MKINANFLPEKKNIVNNKTKEENEMRSHVRTRIVQLVLVLVVACPFCKGDNPDFKELKATDSEVTLQIRMAGEPDSGNGLIAINGGPGLSSKYMLNLEKLSSPTFAVVTYDQRGMGRSTSPKEDVSSYTLLKYVEDLEAVRKKVGLDKVHLFGHSWGGIVAMRYATVYPGRVRSLILVGSGPPTWNGIMKSYQYFGHRIQHLQEKGIIPKTIQPGDTEAILPAYFSDPGFWFSSEDQGGAPEYNSTVNKLTMSAIRGFDITANVAGINQPVLILMGEDDPFGLQMAEEIRNALSQAKPKIITLKNCGHFWHECPEAFATHVRRFLGLSQ